MNLDSTADVLRAAGAHLARHLRYIPDGETGDRYNWLVFQSEVFERHPEMERVPRPQEGYGDMLPLYGLRENADPDSIELRPLGYAEAAESSYAIFRQLRDEGVLPAGVRFQVSLPTPAAVVATFVAAADQPVMEPVYEAALAAELRYIQDTIPTEDLAIQWDLAVEIAMWEIGLGISRPWFEPVRKGTLERFGHIAPWVDASVPLGFHLCYGDFGHQHFMDPVDTAVMTEMANGILDHVERAVSWVHLPVPVERDDSAYFEPLRDLRLPGSTDLYLGLVHADDPDGTARRVATAAETVSRFGVATECGMGRTPRAEIPGLLALHSEVAEPW